MGRLIAWLGIVLGTVYLIFIGGAWWGIYSSTLRTLTMVVAGIALLIWALVAVRDGRWLPSTQMWPAIAAVLGSLAISTIFSSVPRVSVEYLAYAVVLAALYLLLVRLLADAFFGPRLVALMTMLLGVIVMAFFVRVGSYWVHWWEVLGRISLPPLRPGYEGLTYNNPSAVLTMTALLAIPPAAWLGSSRPRGAAVFLILGGLIALVALISGSRSGWFALALTSGIGGATWITSANNRRLLLDQWRTLVGRGVGRLAVSGVVLIVFAVAVAVTPAVLRRVADGGEAVRVAYAATAVRMFAESPIVGTGPGTWVILRPGENRPDEPDFYIPHAHNLEVQTLSELGLVGAFAGVVVLGGMARLLRRGLRTADATTRRWAWVTGFGLLYFGLHQLLDFYVNMPAFLFAMGFPIAYLDARLQRVATPPRRARAPVVIGAIVVGVAVIALLAQEIPASKSDVAVAAANENDWTRADAPAREAAALDPTIGSYQFTAGLTSARIGDHQASAGYFEQVVSVNDLPEAWLNLAAEQTLLGDIDSALTSLERALRTGVQRPAVAMPAGELAMRLGRPDLATVAFAASLANAPSLAGDDWWHADPARAAVYRNAVEVAILYRSDARWELSLVSGDVAGAAAAADPSYLGGFQVDLTAAWAGSEKAAQLVLNACQSNPLDLYRLLWCARLEGHRGDLAAAHALRDLANILFQSSYTGGAEMRVSSEGMTGRQMIGAPADLWATYTYRRPAPWDMLVPSLIHLKLS